MVDETGAVSFLLVKSSPQMVWLGFCLDEDCTVLSQEMAGAVGHGHAFATGTDDGVLVASFGGNGLSSIAMHLCSDSGCSQSGDEFLGLAVGVADAPGRTPVIAYGTYDPETNTDEMFIGICEDDACSSHEPIRVYQTVHGVPARTSLQLLPDGSPVLFYPTDPNAEGRSWDVGVCSNPDCGQVEVHVVTEGNRADSTAQPGLPSVIYPFDTDIRQLRCADDACASLAMSTIHNMTEDAIVLDAVGAYLGGTLYVLVAHTDWDTLGETDPEVNLLRCDDIGCSLIEDVPFTRGHSTAIAALDPTHAVIAVQTGYQLTLHLINTNE